MTTAQEQKLQTFNLRAPKPTGAKGDIPIYTTDLMWMHLKIYTVGGENDLHMHPTEEHSFIVLEGQATFFGRDEEPIIVNPYEGVLLPRGTYYHFRSSGPTNLVMIRIGAGVNSRLLGMELDRRGPDGQHMPGNPKQVGAKRVDIPGEFFKGK